jgi:predicted Fe-Mo cluster-binding NifX family protein
MKRTATVLLLLFGALIFQVQPSLSSASNSDADSRRLLNKIAVAAVGDIVTSDISMIAGKAPYYLIFNENGVFLKSIKNPGQNSGRNSSSVVVNLLLKESCKIVIAGKFGEKLQKQLKENKIEYYQREGIVKSVMQKFLLANKKIQRTY